MIFKKEKKYNPPEGQELLLTADDSLEADILESKLKAYDIPVFRHHRETGAYLTLLLGRSFFGVDIYVPADKLEEARNIVESANEIKDEDILSDPSFQDESIKAENEKLLKKLNTRVWWMAIFFLAAVILLLIISLSSRT